MGVQKALQYQYGSDLVHDLAMSGKGAAGGVKVPVGFRRCQALVPEVHGQGKSGAEPFREGVGFGGLGTQVAGHVQGIAEDDPGAAVFAEQAAKGFQVGFRVSAKQGQNRLRGEAQFIGDGDTDAAVSEIESEEARRHRRIVARRIRANRQNERHLTMS